MDKEQKKALCEAWKLQSKIMVEIRDLAEMSPPLAYGLVRTAETMVDMIFINKTKVALENEVDKGKK